VKKELTTKGTKSKRDSPEFQPLRREMTGFPMATLEDFEKIDIRVGAVIEVAPFSQGKYSTHILMVDFGQELGVKKSLARLTPNYDGMELVDRQVLCVVNFPPRQIGKHLSEVLTLGVPDEQGNVVLIRPDQDAPLGAKLY
jgi:tRNA-binding protein